MEIVHFVHRQARPISLAKSWGAVEASSAVTTLLREVESGAVEAAAAIKISIKMFIFHFKNWENTWFHFWIYFSVIVVVAKGEDISMRKRPRACSVRANVICSGTSVKTSWNSVRASGLWQLNNTQSYSFWLVSELPCYLTAICFPFEFHYIREGLEKTWKAHNKQ